MKALQITILMQIGGLLGYTLYVWHAKPSPVIYNNAEAQIVANAKAWSTCTWNGKEGLSDAVCIDGKVVHIDRVRGMESKAPSPQHPANYYDCAIDRNCLPVQIIDARDPLITALGEAIANEEGWNKPWSLARRLHNPGMLVFAGQPGASFIGSSPYADFSTDDAGWAALYADLRAKWVNSHHARCITQREHPEGYECEVYSIAYDWSTGDREKYARDVVSELKWKGLIK